MANPCPPLGWGRCLFSGKRSPRGPGCNPRGVHGDPGGQLPCGQLRMNGRVQYPSLQQTLKDDDSWKRPEERGWLKGSIKLGTYTDNKDKQAEPLAPPTIWCLQGLQDAPCRAREGCFPQIINGFSYSLQQAFPPLSAVSITWERENHGLTQLSQRLMISLSWSGIFKWHVLICMTLLLVEFKTVK